MLHSAAKRDLGLAAECLMAFHYRDEEDPDGAFVGAVLVADFFGLVRSALVKKT